MSDKQKWINALNDLKTADSFGFVQGQLEASEFTAFVAATRTSSGSISAATRVEPQVMKELKPLLTGIADPTRISATDLNVSEADLGEIVSAIKARFPNGVDKPLGDAVARIK